MVVWHDELVKACFTCASGAIVVSLGWLFGQRLTYQWNVRQKRRELQLSALQQFYQAYGEFFAVWKLWNRMTSAALEHADRVWELHKRAAAAEAILEGIFVKLASEARLDKADIKHLGCFRQAFQQLRQSIRLNVPLPWLSSNSPEYKRFKVLAVHVAEVLNRESMDTRPSTEESGKQLLAITTNSWEGRWVLEETG